MTINGRQQIVYHNRFQSKSKILEWGFSIRLTQTTGTDRTTPLDDKSYIVLAEIMDNC